MNNLISWSIYQATLPDSMDFIDSESVGGIDVYGVSVRYDMMPYRYLNLLYTEVKRSQDLLEECWA